MRSVLLASVAVVAACAAPAKRVAPTLQVHVERQLLATVPIQGEPLYSTLAARMAEHLVPAVSIAVFDDYELVWAAGYGVADRDTGAAVGETTLFQAGSISKSVNALAVMLVAAQGELELDAPINDMLRSWKLPDNELTRASPVTLRRLLGHNAGTTLWGFPGYASGMALPTLVQVLDGTPPANSQAIRVDIEPGSIVRYSGGGTMITQLALVDTLGEPYPAILEQLVLAPLGMGHSTYEQPLPPRHLAHAAAGHHQDGEPVPGKHRVYPEMAAGGLWTTPTDLATFFAELARARAGRSKHVSAAIAQTMTTEIDTESGAGLGLFMSRRNGVAMFGHGGVNEGFQAHAMASLDGGYGFVVMTNSDNGFRIFLEIERTVFAAMGWPGADVPLVRVALTAAERDRLLGSFRFDDGPPFEITVTAKGLALNLPFLEPVELVAVSPDRLVRADNGRRLTFTNDDAIEIADGERKVGGATRLPASARAPLLDLAGRDFEAAVAAWKDELRREPTSSLAAARPNLRYAIDLIAYNRVDDALVVLRAAVMVFPDSADAFAFLGHALAQSHDVPAAIAAFEQSLAKLPTDPAIPPEEKAEVRREVEAALAELRPP